MTVAVPASRAPTIGYQDTMTAGPGPHERTTDPASPPEPSSRPEPSAPAASAAGARGVVAATATATGVAEGSRR